MTKRKPTLPPGYNDALEIGSKIVDAPFQILPPEQKPNAKVIPIAASTEIKPNITKKQQVVAINMRETPIEHMHVRGEIDDEQKFAADEFRRMCEGARMGGAGVIDPEKIRVDMTADSSAVTERAIMAGRELNKVKVELGKFDYELLYCAVTVGISIKELTRLHFAGSVRDKLYVGRSVKHALTRLVDFWKIRAPRKHQVPTGERGRFYRGFSGLTADHRDWTAPPEPAETKAAAKARRRGKKR